MLIVVDPGKMCGLFAVHDTGEPAQRIEAPPYETICWVDSIRLIAKDPVLVVERYVVTSTKMTAQYDALETIGALRYVARRHRIPFEMQSRGDRLRVTTEHLKRLGWWSTTPGGHVNDAARHAWLAFMRHYPTHHIVREMLRS